MNLLPAFTVVGHSVGRDVDGGDWESWWVETPGNDERGDPIAYHRIVVGRLPEWLGRAHTEVRA